MLYGELVKKINTGFKTNQYDELFVDFPIELDEVNLWTYWQGRGVEHPKILLVGQDWGSLDSSKNVEKSIKAIMNLPVIPEEVMYFNACGNKEYFDTDINMAELFKELGDYPDILHKPYKDLFFTNLIPGLRKEGSSTGGFKAKWVTPEAESDFKALVEILQPKVIICLGQNTFKKASLIYGHKNVLRGKSFNQYLDDKPAPQEIKTGSGLITHMFGVAHPGFYGTFNRNGRASLKNGKLKKQIDDWKNIRKWMDENL